MIFSLEMKAFGISEEKKRQASSHGSKIFLSINTHEESSDLEKNFNMKRINEIYCRTKYSTVSLRHFFIKNSKNKWSFPIFFLCESKIQLCSSYFLFSMGEIESRVSFFATYISKE